ncbi:hypothetical protein [Otariodibacter oris]|uniref:Lipoprotein n=1 Tax=Otariodibacter oris TaxID=1032623 RepID=A0A420XEH0_9PAST|nr:hypothetical protein [Otariodibacter oris]RKR70497.1 hypothetical protein DES31_1941 [Otariodibacter oris]
MSYFIRLSIMIYCFSLSGCLVTTVVGGAVSAAGTVVGTAVDVVDTITPDITD